MSLYTLLKFVHVLAAAVWVGGGVAVTALGARSGRERDPAIAGALNAQTAAIGGSVLGPAAVLTLLAGIATTIAGDIPMSTLWIVWGYAGVVISMVLGAGLVPRASRTLQTVVASEGSAAPRADELRARLRLLASVNLVVLVSVVYAMVVKPTL